MTQASFAVKMIQTQCRLLTDLVKDKLPLIIKEMLLFRLQQ